MELVINKNIKISNPETKDFFADSFYTKSDKKLPLVVFVHGYKGYKDWGTWDLVAKKFANAGFFFVKFNMSHNGTTLENPLEFVDLEAFGQNNYTKELSDLGVVIDYFFENPNVDSEKIILIGHSRGGGISIIKTFKDERINTLITLASIDTLDRFPKNEAFENWKYKGFYTIINARTKQEMPHYYQFYEDYEANIHQFDVERAMEMIKAHVLIVHGTKDDAVSDKSAEHLHVLNPNSDLFLVENSNHTFGAKEPWFDEYLPPDLEVVVEKCINFINKNV